MKRRWGCALPYRGPPNFYVCPVLHTKQTKRKDATRAGGLPFSYPLVKSGKGKESCFSPSWPIFFLLVGIPAARGPQPQASPAAAFAAKT